MYSEPWQALCICKEFLTSIKTKTCRIVTASYLPGGGVCTILQTDGQQTLTNILMVFYTM
jgi:hypothetical protein